MEGLTLWIDTVLEIEVYLDLSTTWLLLLPTATLLSGAELMLMLLTLLVMQVQLQQLLTVGCCLLALNMLPIRPDTNGAPIVPNTPPTAPRNSFLLLEYFQNLDDMLCSIQQPCAVYKALQCFSRTSSVSMLSILASTATISSIFLAKSSFSISSIVSKRVSLSSVSASSLLASARWFLQKYLSSCLGSISMIWLVALICLRVIPDSLSVSTVKPRDLVQLLQFPFLMLITQPSTTQLGPTTLGRIKEKGRLVTTQLVLLMQQVLTLLLSYTILFEKQEARKTAVRIMAVMRRGVPTPMTTFLVVVRPFHQALKPVVVDSLFSGSSASNSFQSSSC